MAAPHDSRAAGGSAPPEQPHTLLGLLDPSRYLAAAIGWAVVIVAVVAGLAAGVLAAVAAERQVRDGSERMLAQLARQTERTLAANLALRLSVVQALAAHVEASDDWSPEALRRQLAAAQDRFPEFAWIGLADERGRIRAATGGLLEGQDVGERPWFRAGAQGPWLGDVHDAVLLDRLLREPGAPPLRFVDAVAPLRDAASRPMVLGAHLSWRWIETLQRESLRSLGAHQGVELLLLSAQGKVLGGPKALLGREFKAPATDLAEGGVYLVRTATPDRIPGRARVDWSVLVRQHRDAALAPAAAVQRRVFLTVLLVAVAAGCMAIGTSWWLTRPLRRLAADAVKVRHGQLRELPRLPGNDEIGRIGGTLAGTVHQLQQEKAALAQLNDQLDAKVLERTREVRRLAEENQRLAVTRERLRMARDVHDSLANTLVGLLNQFRLLQTLRERGRDGELEAALSAAEGAARQGVAEARAAITQMRHNNVAEAGLAPALAVLLERFAARTGVPHRLDAAGTAEMLPPEHAEVAFRIAEEALRNCERHAQARQVRVGLRVVAGVWELAVTDDGTGFDPAQPRPGHYGLKGLVEQAGSVGAGVVVDSAPGRGTRVVLRLAPVGAAA